MDEKDERLKVVIVGDGFCGKTCMVLRYTRNEFPDNYIPTVCEATATSVTLDDKKVMLVLWDTAGQEDYDRLRPLCYQRTSVVVICFAVNLRSSYENIEAKWMPEVRHHCPDAPVVIVATKTDLRQKSGAGQSLTTNDGSDLALRLSADAYTECSSKTGDGVAKVFQIAAREATKTGRQFNCNRRRRCDLL